MGKVLVMQNDARLAAEVNGTAGRVAKATMVVMLLMAVKAVCDRVDDLKPIGELLGA